MKKNQAIISNLNLNMNKYYEIINKDEIIKLGENIVDFKV